jgi:hypothetical protein
MMAQPPAQAAAAAIDHIAQELVSDALHPPATPKIADKDTQGPAPASEVKTCFYRNTNHQFTSTRVETLPQRAFDSVLISLCALGYAILKQQSLLTRPFRNKSSGRYSKM